MQFSVIYSVDVPEDENISRFSPPDLDLWEETEGDDQSDTRLICVPITNTSTGDKP